MIGKSLELSQRHLLSELLRHHEVLVLLVLSVKVVSQSLQEGVVGNGGQSSLLRVQEILELEIMEF